jgi:hypothetical protein
VENGDLSNALPLRVLVTADVIIDAYEEKQRGVLGIPKMKKRVEYNRLVLSHLYMVTVRRGWTMELISFTHSEKALADLVLYLDKFGTNPFRYATSYKNIEKLVDELPYRPEVVGVIDMPHRLLRYGRWGLDFPSL